MTHTVPAGVLQTIEDPLQTLFGFSGSEGRVGSVLIAVTSGYEPAFDREWRHPGQKVATVLPLADQRLVDRNLKKQILDVGSRIWRRTLSACNLEGTRRKFSKKRAGRH